MSVGRSVSLPVFPRQEGCHRSAECHGGQRLTDVVYCPTLVHGTVLAPHAAVQLPVAFDIRRRIFDENLYFQNEKESCRLAACAKAAHVP